MKNLDAQRLSKLSQWRERILARSESGHSIRRWCKENGFTDQQYYYWHRQVRDAQLELPPEPSCQLLKIEAAIAKSSSVNTDVSKDKIIVKQGHLTIELPVGIGASFVIDLLRGLEP